jgi:hypothetical protein
VNAVSEAVRAVRTVIAPGAVPKLAAVVSYAPDRALNDALPEDVDGYLFKPVSRQSLFRFISNTMGVDNNKPPLPGFGDISQRLRSGRVRRKVIPIPPLATEMLPLWSSAIFCTMASPSPTPVPICWSYR